jgi:hypothetical protein
LPQTAIEHHRAALALLRSMRNSRHSSFAHGRSRLGLWLARASQARMAAFYEEDERIVGHAADPYHRVDIRQTSRHLTVWYQDQVIADTRRPLALYESGFAPRWYVPRADVDEAVLTPAQGQTF